MFSKYSFYDQFYPKHVVSSFSPCCFIRQYIMIVIASSPYITVVSDDDSVVDLDDAKLP